MVLSKVEQSGHFQLTPMDVKLHTCKKICGADTGLRAVLKMLNSNQMRRAKCQAATHSCEIQVVTLVLNVYKYADCAVSVGFSV